MMHATWNRNGRRVLGLPTWQIVLMLALALALGVAIAVVATGIFLIVFPIALIAALAYRLFGPHRRRFGDRRDAGVIEGEYEVLDGARPPQRHPRR